MDNSLLSSSPLRDRAPKSDWEMPIRSKIRVLAKEGHSKHEISRLTSVPRSTVQDILKSGSSRRTRKGKEYKKKILGIREIRRVLRYVTASWDNRRASYTRVRQELGLNCSTTTLRRTLRSLGYRRCVACPRPFINQDAAARRLAFAKKYQWWPMTAWKRVLWSDEAIFELGKRGQIWVTPRPDEKACQNCIKSVYRSGRVSIMLWGAIGWDWKSPLVFLEHEECHRGICSHAYTNQILNPVVIPYYESLTKEQQVAFLYVEDGTKIHKGQARLIKLNRGIQGFDWPPSSPDLNPIEKVWCWMKHQIGQRPDFPTTLEDLKQVLRELWDQIDPVDWRYLTHRLTCKLDDVIQAKGMATVK
jgi:hypothetical protein